MAVQPIFRFESPSGLDLHKQRLHLLKSIAMITEDDYVDQWKARGVFYNMLRDASVDNWGDAETFRVSVRSVWSVVPWVPKAKKPKH